MKITCSCGASLDCESQDYPTINQFMNQHGKCSELRINDAFYNKPEFREAFQRGLAKRYPGRINPMQEGGLSDGNGHAITKDDVEIREAFIPGLGTVRACIDCGCLVSGGPTRCTRCAADAKEPMFGTHARLDYSKHPPKITFDPPASDETLLSVLDSSDFKECPTCANKPGTPELCESCLHNRWLISRLKDLRADLVKVNAISDICCDAWKRRYEKACQCMPSTQILFDELIMAVERVFPNETRFQTALRYIREAEESAKSGPTVTEVHHSCPP